MEDDVGSAIAASLFVKIDDVERSVLFNEPEHYEIAEISDCLMLDAIDICQQTSTDPRTARPRRLAELGTFGKR